jgi:hypothetical protein
VFEIVDRDQRFVNPSVEEPPRADLMRCEAGS